MIGVHLGHSDHEMMEFSIFGEIRRNISKTLTLGFQRADFGLFRRVIQRVPWKQPLKTKAFRKGGRASKQRS